MNGKSLLALSLSIFLCFLLLHVSFNSVEARSPGDYGVHNVNSGLNYTTVQAAINAPETLDGHTIQVDAGIYYEHVLVNKSVCLVGEGRTATIVDANRTGKGIDVRSSNARISGFTVQNAGYPPYGDTGISLESVKNCTVTDNEVKDCRRGIWLRNSGGSILERNTMTRNSYNFQVLGRYLSDFINYVDSSNLVDEKPIYYWINRHDEQMPFDAGYAAAVNSTNITICDLNLSKNGQGILLAFVNGTTIRNVNITNNFDGIWMADSKNCRLTACNAEHNGEYGMDLERSVDCTIVGNNVNKNGYEFPHGGFGIYLMDCRNVSTVENDAHENNYAIVVRFSKNCAVRSNDVSNNTGMGIWPKYASECLFNENYACNNGFYGIEPEDSEMCVVSGNNASNNKALGIWLLGCNNLSVTGNHVKANKIGIGLTDSNFNDIFHNDFVINKYQTTIENSTNNKWDADGEGNYWSDYEGSDANHDGIGDIAYGIDENDSDQFPLMGAFEDFNIRWDYYVDVVSNSSIADFAYSESTSTITMHIFRTSETESFGFCRVSIPKDLMIPPYTIIIDGGSTEVLYFDGNVFDNGTHRWIYFSYGYPTSEVNIIPEFPPATLIPLLIIAAFPAVILHRRRRVS